MNIAKLSLKLLMLVGASLLLCACPLVVVNYGGGGGGGYRGGGGYPPSSCGQPRRQSRRSSYNDPRHLAYEYRRRAEMDRRYSRSYDSLRSGRNSYGYSGRPMYGASARNPIRVGQIEFSDRHPGGLWR